MPMYTLRKTRLPTKPGRHSDGGGLYLQIAAGGTSSWLFRYERGGLAHWMGLGSTKTFTLEQARERARLERARLHDGIDPLAARNAERAERRRQEASAITFRDAAAQVIAAREADWHPEHARQWRVSIDEVDRVLGSVPVGTIDTGLILKAIEPIWRRAQTTGDRTRQRIEVVLDWSTARGARIGDNPARWKGHLEHLLKDGHRVVHHAAMAYTDVAGFVRELRTRSGTAAKALEFLVLCACRTGEVLGAQWSEIDLLEKTWTIPPERLKTGKRRPDRPHIVPLAPAALKILAGQRRGKRAYVFPAPHADHPMERHALADLMRAMGRAETVHGFRSCFADWAADNTAYPQEVREQALAHAISNKVESAYRRGALLEKRGRLMREWSRYCDSPAAAGGAVVSIASRT